MSGPDHQGPGRSSSFAEAVVEFRRLPAARRVSHPAEAVVPSGSPLSPVIRAVAV